MPDSLQTLLRSLPQIEEVLKYPSSEKLLERLPRARVTDLARAAVDDVRQAVFAGTVQEVNTAVVEERLLRRSLELDRASLRRAVNATGVLIHTNLGRSPLAQSAIDAVVNVAKGYSTLEYDTDRLERGSRHDHCERLLCMLTGAEAAIAVNNNAAAVMMVLAEFASGSSAVVSRGELVEIGGSFRVPDIMRASHADMIEVGTTNKTHLSDYEDNLRFDTSMLLKVHPSNFRTVGFTEAVAVSDLRRLADRINERRRMEAAHEGSPYVPLLVYEDQGSGAFAHLDCFGDYDEPVVCDSLAEGADIVSFSGDKLLGGPQAGVIVGKKEYIARLKKNPLARALRLDKMTLAALEATLRLYLDQDTARRDIPVLRMLTEQPQAVQERALRLWRAIEAAVPEGCAVTEVVPERGCAGGGSLPLCELDTFAVRVAFEAGDALSCERYLASERDVPVVCRLKKEMLLFDARTLLGQDDIDEVAAGLREYFEQRGTLTE